VIQELKYYVNIFLHRIFCNVEFAWIWIDNYSSCSRCQRDVDGGSANSFIPSIKHDYRRRFAISAPKCGVNCQYICRFLQVVREKFKALPLNVQCALWSCHSSILRGELSSLNASHQILDSAHVVCFHRLSFSD